MKVKNWYIAIDNEQGYLGPFDAEEIITKYNNRFIELDSFVWCRDFKEKKWIRFQDCILASNLLKAFPKIDPPNLKSFGAIKRIENKISSSNNPLFMGKYPIFDKEVELQIVAEDKIVEVRTSKMSENAIWINSRTESLHTNKEYKLFIKNSFPPIGMNVIKVKNDKDEYLRVVKTPLSYKESFIKLIGESFGEEYETSHI